MQCLLPNAHDHRDQEELHEPVASADDGELPRCVLVGCDRHLPTGACPRPSRAFRGSAHTALSGLAALPRSPKQRAGLSTGPPASLPSRAFSRSSYMSRCRSTVRPRRSTCSLTSRSSRSRSCAPHRRKTSGTYMTLMPATSPSRRPRARNLDSTDLNADGHLRIYDLGKAALATDESSVRPTDSTL